MKSGENRIAARMVGKMARGLLLAAVLSELCEAGEPTPAAKKIKPAEAAQHIGETCEIEMDVRSSRRGDRPISFLNSEKDFGDKKNFTVVILEEGLAKFNKSGIAKPEKHFAGKRIRVTGTVEEYRGRPQIRADEPRQIEIVEPPTPPSQSPQK